MAVNESRSMNAELHEGGTDGTVKKYAPNRGGVIDGTNIGVLQRLHDCYYDVSVSEAIKHQEAGRWASLQG